MHYGTHDICGMMIRGCAASGPRVRARRSSRVCVEAGWAGSTWHDACRQGQRTRRRTTARHAQRHPPIPPARAPIGSCLAEPGLACPAPCPRLASGLNPVLAPAWPVLSCTLSPRLSWPQGGNGNGTTTMAAKAQLLVEEAAGRAFSAMRNLFNVATGPALIWCAVTDVMCRAWVMMCRAWAGRAGGQATPRPPLPTHTYSCVVGFLGGAGEGVCPDPCCMLCCTARGGGGCNGCPCCCPSPPVMRWSAWPAGCSTPPIHPFSLPHSPPLYWLQARRRRRVAGRRGGAGYDAVRPPQQGAWLTQQQGRKVRTGHWVGATGGLQRVPTRGGITCLLLQMAFSISCKCM